MTNLSKSLLVAFGALALLSAGCASTTNINNQAPATTTTTTTLPETNYTTPLQLGDQQLMVEIADTDLKREQGLSGRERLADNQAMLFDFRRSNDNQPQFWMKDMKFALDLIWIDHGRVIGITPNVLPPTSNDSPLPTYAPPGKVDMVIEITAGWSAARSVKVGDEVKL